MHRFDAENMDYPPFRDKMPTMILVPSKNRARIKGSLLSFISVNIIAGILLILVNGAKGGLPTKKIQRRTPRSVVFFHTS